MLEELKGQLEGRTFIGIDEIDNKDLFKIAHEDLGFYLCHECDYYIREDKIDVFQGMCFACLKNIKGE